jgi:hypothetical protein
VKDPKLEAYCDAIESFFFRWKERPGELSPRDFRRVRGWYEAGVPLEAVFDGISEAFRAQRAGRAAGVEEVNSLGYCEGFVRRAVEQRRDV